MDTSRADGIAKVYNDVRSLMDNQGRIRGDRLQALKEAIDREIYDSGGWKDTGPAADRARMAGWREGNGLIRDELRSVGGERLADANDNFSHFADVAKIIETQRPDLAGLPEQQAARALTPLRGSPAQQMIRTTIKKAAPYVAGATGGHSRRRL